jgi:hypothetical protein
MTEPATSQSARRDPIHQERLEVLEMLAAGTITAEEAEALLDALDRGRSARFGAAPGGSPADRARHVRIRVVDGASGRNKVNLTLPIGVVEAGLAIARRFAPGRAAEAESMREAIATGFRGHLLDVDNDGERVEIFVE